MRRTLALAVLLCPTVLAFGQEVPRALLEKAIIAQGGERLARARSVIRSAKGELDAFPKPIAFVGEAQFNLPEQARWSFELEQDKQKSLILLVLNKDKGWRSSGGAVKDLGPRELEDLREEAYVHYVMTLLPLLQNGAELAALPDAKVNDQPAAGLKVTSKGKPEVRLYFDKTTNLLAKAEYKGREADLAVTKEIIVGGYKEFAGIKLPTKFLVQSNGKRVAEWTVTAYKLPDRVEEAAFQKP